MGLVFDEALRRYAVLVEAKGYLRFFTYWRRDNSYFIFLHFFYSSSPFCLLLLCFPSLSSHVPTIVTTWPKKPSRLDVRFAIMTANSCTTLLHCHKQVPAIAVFPSLFLTYLLATYSRFHPKRLLYWISGIDRSSDPHSPSHGMVVAGFDFLLY